MSMDFLKNPKGPVQPSAINPRLKSQEVLIPEASLQRFPDKTLRLLIIGPTGCGKSWWIYHFLLHRERFLDYDFDQVFFCHPAKTLSLQAEVVEKIRKLYPNIQIHEGLLPADVILRHHNSHQRTLIIFGNLFFRNMSYVSM